MEEDKIVRRVRNRRLMGSAVLVITNLVAGFAQAATQLPQLNWPAKRSDWVNVKTDVAPAAVGDGLADDTVAIQTAIERISSAAHWVSPRGVYLPAGTYKITASLHLKQKYGAFLVGHGRDTRIVWAGAAGGRMLWCDGSPHSRFVGVIWDGAGIAGVGIDHDSKSNYETWMLHKHEEFRNFTEAGVRIGHAQVTASAELHYQNCLFTNSVSGIKIMEWNDYNNMIQGCDFIGNTYGVYCPNGSGNFNLYECHFSGSTSTDIYGPIHACSVRRTTSTASRLFYECGGATGKNAIMFENCVVDGWTHAGGAIIFRAGGPITITDSKFTNPPNTNPPLSLAQWTGMVLRVIASNNTYAPCTALVNPGGNGQITEVTGRTYGGVITSATQSFFTDIDPVYVPTGTFYDAKVNFNAVGNGAADDTNAIQNCINAAKSAGNNAIAYIPAGIYKITGTLVVDGGNYRVGGVGLSSRLHWGGAIPGGPMMRVTNPQNIILEALEFTGPAAAQVQRIQQTGTGGSSSVLYDYLDTNAWTSPDRSGGLDLIGLPASNTVRINSLLGDLNIRDSNAATIVANIALGAQITTSNASHGAKSGYAGFVFAPNWGMTVNDNQDLIISDNYTEQASSFLKAYGNGNTGTTGRITLSGGGRINTFDHPELAYLNDYQGRVFINANGIDPQTSAGAYVVPQFNCYGTATCDLTLCGLGFATIPAYTTSAAERLIVYANAGQDLTNGNQLTIPEYQPAGYLNPTAAAFDDLAELGRYAISANYFPTLAPASLTATAMSSGMIHLAWTDNSTNEDGFRIERSTDGINFSVVWCVPANTVAFDSCGLAADTRYTYRVRAYTLAGDSAATNPAAATTDAAAGELRIQAESYNALSGSMYTNGYWDGMFAVQNTTNDTWLRYDNINFGNGFHHLVLGLAANDPGRTIEARLDSHTGTLVGTLPVTATGGWSFYTEETMVLTGAAGTHNLYLIFRTPDGGSVVNLDYLKFTGVISPPTVTLTATPVTISEAGGTAKLTATLSRVCDLPVTVNLTLGGTATLVADYTRSGISIAIPAGQTSNYVTITVTQDLLAEPDETVVADIASVTNAVENGTQQVTVTILDDDASPTSANHSVVTVEDGAFAFQVTDFPFADADAGNALQSVMITALPVKGSLRLDNVTIAIVPQTVPVAGLASGKLTYAPAADDYGPACASFGFKVSDGVNWSTFANTMTIDVTAVNDAPTLTAIADPAVIPAGAATQTVNLTGISTGAANEVQTLTVTAVSANPALIPHPTVTYTSPDPTATLSYTPVAGASGAAVITVTVDDGGTTNHTVQRTFNVVVVPPPTITSGSPLPAGSVGTACGQTLTASGGAPPYVWTLASGSLPAGLSLSTAGVISGVPTVAAESSFRVRVTDADTRYAEQDFLLTIWPAPVYAWANFAGQPGSAGNADGTGNTARFNFATGTAVDSAGNLFVADRSNHTIRKVTPAGEVTTFAGSTGVPGKGDGTGGAARFNLPYGVAVDAAGNLFVADTSNHTIRKVTPAGAVTTLAGSAGVAGSADGTGSAARFSLPYGVAVDSAGNVFVADRANHTIRKVTAAGVVTTLAGSPGVSGSADGTGNAARFSNPYGVAVDSAGNVLVADRFSHAIRQVTPAGVVTTLAGSPGVPGSTDGTASAARFREPCGVAVDGAGNVLVSDFMNSTVRKMVPQGGTWAVTTIGGSPGTPGTADGSGSAARFNHPFGLAVDAAGTVFVADYNCHRISKGTLLYSPPLITTPSPLPAGTVAVACRQTLTASGGTAPYTWSVASGALPSGLSLSAAGVLSGTPDAVGTAGFAVRVTGNDGLAATKVFSLTIALSPAITSNSPLPAGNVGTAYNQALTAGGGTPPYTWTLASGSLPAGLTLSTAGAISGTPGAAGTSSFTVRVTDSEALFATSAFSLTIWPVPVYAWANFAGQPGSAGNTNGTGNTAQFHFATGAAVDGAGNLFVADRSNHTIRKVTPAGTATTLAGSAGFSGKADGTGGAARFNLPYGVAVDATGNVFVADTSNHTIRKVTPAGAVTTLAGSAGVAGSADGTGSAARFNLPYGVAVDTAGNVFVADKGNHTIRKVTAAGVVTTLAGSPAVPGTADGTGGAARFNGPYGVAVDGAGNVLVADRFNHTIRQVTPAGVVTTLAGSPGVPGSADGAASAARFREPCGVAVDGAGNILVGDFMNNTVRKMISHSGTWAVTTIGGSAGTPGTADGVGGAARFNYPFGLAVDAAGTVFVADYNCHRISKGTLLYSPPVITTPSPLPVGMVAAACNQALTAGGGTAPYTWAVASGALPSGLSLSTGGVISGTPDTVGTAGFAVRVTGNDGLFSTKAFSLTIGLPPTITSSSPLPAGSVGVVYSQTLTASGGTPPCAWTLASGSLPAGLTLSTTGVISGTPSAPATAGFRVRVTGADGMHSGKDLSLTIWPVPAYAWANFAGQPGVAGNANGIGSAAQFNFATGAAVDGAGNLFVADRSNHTIRKITPAGAVTTFAGSPGLAGSADGTGGAARFNLPYGLAVDAAGNLFVADTSNHTIRRVTPAGAVTTLAGSPGLSGTADGTGSAARFALPYGVAVDSAGNVFVADKANHTIRKITPQDGTWVVTTLAGSPAVPGTADGTGGAARFNGPYGVAADSAGNVLVTDRFNHAIRQVTPAGVVTTLTGRVGVSGKADGAASAARFREPCGVAVDSAGNIFVGDFMNSTVRKIVPQGETWAVTTIGGLAGVPGTADGLGSAARFNYPFGLAVDTAGSVFVADYNCHRISKGTLLYTPPVITTPSLLPAGMVAAAYNQTLTASGGTAPYTWSVASGTLPSGLSLSTGGVISGTPDAAGTVSFPVQVTGNDGLAATTVFRLTIAREPTITTPSPLPAGNVDTAYNQALTADGGMPPYTWTLVSGSLPTGLTLSTGGAIGGTPGAATTSSFSVRVTGADTGYSEQNFSLTIWPVPAYAWANFVGQPGSAGNADGTGNTARFNLATGVALDAAGTLFVADRSNHTIRKVTPAGTATTLAGSAGLAGKVDGTGGAARFNYPFGLAADTAGNVFVADTYNHTIRKVTPAGTVTTLAGSAGLAGKSDGTGSTARFSFPYGVAVDSAGNVFVADKGNHTIRKMTPQGGAWVVTTLAGSPGLSGSADGPGGAARFNNPFGVAVDRAGNVLVADHFNHTIRQVTLQDGTWTVTTIGGSAGVPGTADGTGSAARFREPCGVAVDSAGNLFVGDFMNSTVRKMIPQGGTWSVTTIGGLAGVPGTADGTGGAARFNYPFGLAVDAAGSVFVADFNCHRISRGMLLYSPPVITTPSPLPVGTVAAACSQTLTASGGTTPYTWTIASGNLPSGLSLSAAGVLSGTPDTAGTVGFAVRVTGNDGLSSTKAFSLTINPPARSSSPQPDMGLASGLPAACPVLPTVSPSAAPPSQPGNALPAEVTVVSVADPAAVLATVSLATGWNLFSLPVANLTAQDVAPAGGVAALFSWSAGAWTSVTADTPLTAGAGYWLYLTAAPCSITVAGAVPQSPEVANPNPEWNLVGPITVQAVDDLGSAWGTPGPVWTWDNVAKAYQPETWRLYPGRGYWIWCPPR